MENKRLYGNEMRYARISMLHSDMNTSRLLNDVIIVVHFVSFHRFVENRLPEKWKISLKKFTACLRMESVKSR